MHAHGGWGSNPNIFTILIKFTSRVSLFYTGNVVSKDFRKGSILQYKQLAVFQSSRFVLVLLLVHKQLEASFLCLCIHFNSHYTMLGGSKFFLPLCLIHFGKFPYFVLLSCQLFGLILNKFLHFVEVIAFGL